MKDRLLKINLEIDYLLSIKILRETYNGLVSLKNELILKKMNIEEAKKQISLLNNLIGRVPIWNNKQNGINLNDRDNSRRIFDVGKKVSRKMEGKVPVRYLFDVIDDRWKGVNDIVQDIDEIRINISNYSVKIFTSYFTCGSNTI